MPGRRSTSVMAVLGGVLVLAGCQNPAGSHAAAGTPSASPPSTRVSEPAGTPSNGAATTASASPTGTPTTTSTPSHTSAAPVRAASPARSGTPPTSASPDCRNLTVSSEVKAAVTRAYQASFPRFVHVRPMPYQFFYGQCGGVRYAATRFEAIAGATHEELVGMQDEGSATQYFRRAAGGSWTYVTSDGSPRGPHGCGDVPQIPGALSATWGDCAIVR
ncbi:hypothetical protein ACWCQ0_30595 [Streptomyces massasporeus]|uniref:hypothetical protein n=1 Tax=Streptomyces massasporeus TaxID=67324 RepID=UPI0034117FFE